MALMNLPEGFGGSLNIEVSEPLLPIVGLNERAAPTATIIAITFDPNTFDGEDIQEVTEEQLTTNVYDYHEIALVWSPAPDVDDHKYHRDAPNGTHFTLQDVIDTIVQAQYLFRPYSDWFGGIDTSHTYFEGFTQRGEHTFSIFWGS